MRYFIKLNEIVLYNIIYKRYNKIIYYYYYYYYYT